MIDRTSHGEDLTRHPQRVPSGLASTIFQRDRGPELNQDVIALDEYLQALEGNDPRALVAWEARYPDVLERLKEQLATLRELHGAASVLRVEPETIPNVGPQGMLGNYRLVREIGRGGMGVVFEAEDTTLGRRVALKVLPFAAILNDKQLARFRNEAQAAARLHHPHIVPVYAVGVDRGVHYYAMQYIDGQSLEDAIAELGQHDGPGDRPGTDASPWFPKGSMAFLRKSALLIRDVALALQHAHELGILHRDIKPSNLLLDSAGQIWVTDFGLARLPGDGAMTSTGDVLGTARYMSPEQASGGGTFVDPRTDIYSLGITLYELVTLRPAFPAETRDQFLRHIHTVDPIAPSRINPAIPPALEAVIAKAIEKEPARRYATAREFAADLRCYLDGELPQARKHWLRDTARRWTRRHRRLVTAVVITLLVGCGSYLITAGIVQHRTSQALAEARASYAQAEENYRTARLAVDKFGLGMSERLASVPGAEEVRREILRETLKYYARFITQARRDPSLKGDVGLALLKSGGIHEQLGAVAEASEAYDQAIEALRIVSASPARSVARDRDLARGWNNRGLLRSRLGRTEGALVDLTQARELQMALLEGATNDDEADSLRGDLACSLGNQAFVRTGMGESREAMELLREAIRLEDVSLQGNALVQQPLRAARLAVSLHNLACLIADQDLSEAESLARKSMDIQERLVKAYPEALNHRADLALSCNNLAVLLIRGGQPTAAADFYQRGVVLGEQLVAQSPAVVSYRCDLAISINNYGRALLRLDRAAEAQSQFQRACGILEELLGQHGEQVELLAGLSGAKFNHGMALRRLGDQSAGDIAVQTAVELQRKVCQLAPRDPRQRALLDQLLHAAPNVVPPPAPLSQDQNSTGVPSS